jgi:hypothetical protein
MIDMTSRTAIFGDLRGAGGATKRPTALIGERGT